MWVWQDSELSWSTECELPELHPERGAAGETLASSYQSHRRGHRPGYRYGDVHLWLQLLRRLVPPEEKIEKRGELEMKDGENGAPWVAYLDEEMMDEVTGWCVVKGTREDGYQVVYGPFEEREQALEELERVECEKLGHA